MFFDFPKIGASMQDALADPAAIPCLQILRGYWEGLRQDGALPHREAVSPSGLGGALENCFIVERIAPGIGRFRVAGSAVTDVLGLEPRGMPLTMLLEPVARGTLTRVLDEVFTAATALDITLEAERAIGRPHLAARMILLPIRGANGEYHQAIGYRRSGPVWPNWPRAAPLWHHPHAQRGYRRARSLHPACASAPKPK